jgi:membrane protein implicated in regulation of membrane protease activity
VQLLVFAALALVFAMIGRRISASSAESDQPMLNRRVEGLVGRTATLEDPISEGKGRIRLDDTTWIVQGPTCRPVRGCASPRLRPAV